VSALLNQVVDASRKALPNATVAAATLESSIDRPLGPLDPLLDHLDVAQSVRDKFEVLPAANTSPPTKKLEKLLELNRSNLSDDDLRTAKRALNKQVF
jgi:hypothetical protein